MCAGRVARDPGRQLQLPDGHARMPRGGRLLLDAGRAHGSGVRTPLAALDQTQRRTLGSSRCGRAGAILECGNGLRGVPGLAGGFPGAPSALYARLMTRRSSPSVTSSTSALVKSRPLSSASLSMRRRWRRAILNTSARVARAYPSICAAMGSARGARNAAAMKAAGTTRARTT